MSSLHLFSVVALVGGIVALPVSAQDTQAESAGSQYQLKSRSSFNVSDDARTPFWPIGHVKINRQARVQVAAVPTTKLDPEMFSVTSISLGSASLAIINGRTYGEGDYLRQAKPLIAGRQGRATDSTRPTKVVALDPQIRIRVVRIVDGSVTLQSADGQSVTVPLRRPELNERKPEEVEFTLEQ